MVDNWQSDIGLLISLKCQAIQAFRTSAFVSYKYPGVGLYSSPVLQGQMIFMDRDNSSNHDEPSVWFL